MYGASSSIVVSMLTPFARRVISRTRRLNQRERAAKAELGLVLVPRPGPFQCRRKFARNVLVP
jgi:hypothetical protein